MSRHAFAVLRIAAIVCCGRRAPPRARSGPTMFARPANVPAAYKEARCAGRARRRSVLPRAAAGGDSTAIPSSTALESQVVLNNQTVLAAEARVRQAQALIDVARAPSFLTANAASHQQESRRSPQAGKSICGVASGAASKRATAYARSSADDLAAATLSLQAQVAQSYFLLRVQDARDPARCRTARRDTSARCSSRETSMPSASPPAATSCRRRRSSCRRGPRRSRRS